MNNNTHFFKKFIGDTIRIKTINVPSDKKLPVIPMVKAVIDGKEIYVMEDNHGTAA